MSAIQAKPRVDERQPAQRAAANPVASVWVNASAGTGKTRVLVDRVLRLLLAGVKPRRILCLTFTKAAAAEMATRLTAELGHWAVMEEGALIGQIEALTGAAPDRLELQRARTLFACLLDASGGLQISTLHGFCQSLLARFPLEAGVPPGFQVLDERLSRTLIETAETDLLKTAPPFIRSALTELLGRFARADFASLLNAMVSHRVALTDAIEAEGSVNGAIQRLAAELGLSEGATPEKLLAAFVAAPARDTLRTVLPALSSSPLKTDQKNFAALADWLALPPDARAAGYGDYSKIFVTEKGTPRAQSGLITGKPANSHPETLELLLTEQRAVLAFEQSLAAAEVLAQTVAFLIVAHDLLARYEKLKASRMALDYDDLIDRAVGLVTRAGGASWVMFKLDGGLDHILVDEAQDTNPSQWRLILALAGEFYSGLGITNAPRTLFAVGDYKQSIYSFQGAEPAAFIEAREQVRGLAAGGGLPFADVGLNLSYRSVGAVLQLVDKVFEGVAGDGVVLPEQRPLVHAPFRAGMAGHVELWPLLAPAEKPEAEAWAMPDASAAEIPAPPLLAARVLAERIAGWVRAGELLPARGRPIRYGDILVLVKKRGAFVEAFIREAKNLGIPISGADRMKLLEQLVVEDLLALIDVLLLPEDDLTLATILKGPLIGMNEADMFALAHGRGGTLWDALRQQPAIYQYLSGLRGRADFMPPHALLVLVLTTACPASRSGRHALLTRLGPEAADPLDELLSVSLMYERTEAATLQGFLLWLRRAESEIKRELEQAGGLVRVMTVHGAKGLQAPVVILADAVSGTGHGRGPQLLFGEKNAVPLLAYKASVLPGSLWADLKAQRQAAEIAEYRRLLYVALTRAEDRLYIVGWRTRNKPMEGNWFELIAAALTQLTVPTPMDLANGWQGDGLILTTAQQAPVVAQSAVAATLSTPEPLPAWARQPVSPEPTPTRPLTPSQPVEEEPAVFSPLSGADPARFRRGLLIHRLLQTLPELPAPARAAAAHRWLANEPNAADLAAEVMRVLDDPRFTHVFGPGSRAEVPITGRIGDSVVSGQIDRLAVTDEAIWLVDYKSNRPPATAPELVAPAYLRQLAAYRAILQRVYPGRPVLAHLLWTFKAEMMEIPAPLLDPYAPDPHIEDNS